MQRPTVKHIQLADQQEEGGRGGDEGGGRRTEEAREHEQLHLLCEAVDRKTPLLPRPPALPADGPVSRAAVFVAQNSAS